MRFKTLFIISLLLFPVVARPALASAAIDTIVVHADRVAFYSSKYVVKGDGNVRVTLSDGATITGRAFQMDLKMNRFVIAGDVHVIHGSNTYDGAAFAEFLELKRGYFLPATPEPDRWTFMDGDYSKPVKGREMPGDTFDMPETGSDHPLVLSKEATIVPKTGVALKPARIYTEGVYVPTPSYYQNFSPNPYLVENSLAGATGGVGYPFIGGPHSATTLFGRYDSTNKTYLAIQQNFGWQNAYIVGSVSPLTRPDKEYNLLGLIKTSNQRFQVSTFEQLNTFQSGFSMPLSASALENMQFTYALKNSFLQFTAFQYHDDLVAPGYNQGHGFVPMHPNNFSLSWVGANQRISKYIPISFKLRGGIQTAHDSYGIGTFDNNPYTSYWQHYLGFTIFSNPLNITPHLPFDQAVNVSTMYDRQRTFVSSFPRWQDQQTLTTVVSKLQGHKGSMYLAYVIQNEGDYLGALQPVMYPPTVFNNPFNGQTYPGFAAYDCFVTQRTLQYSYTYTPTPYFSFTFVAEKHKDFPDPIPYYWGNPPYDVTGRIQMRISPILSVQIQRSYYFNFGPQGWNQWLIQFGP
ncbi:MAG: hypothetical protein ACREMT_04200 [Vulcanimicrobiaceae bacterium]